MAFCFRCGSWQQLDSATAWCGDCTEAWRENYRARENLPPP